MKSQARFFPLVVLAFVHLAFSQAPTLTSVSPNPVSVGAQLTVNGSGFGASQGSGFVTLYNVHGTVVSWSDTQIVVTVPTNALPGNVYVQQNGVNSNTVPYSIAAPIITSVSPKPVAVGAQLTINGSGFGAGQGSYGAVALYNVYGTVVSWSDTQIVVTVPSNALPGNVVVKQNGENSNGVPYTITAPTITSVSPKPVAVGAQLTINGSGFGASQGTYGFVSLYNVHGTVVSWSDTQIVVTVPTNALPGNVYVQQNGVNSNTVPYSIAAPIITSVSPTPVAVGGQLTINGSGFGASQGSYGFVSLYNVHGTVVSWSDTQIVVTVPTNALPGNVYVQQNGVNSNTVPYSITASAITGISPNPVAAGGQLTINGTGFGAGQGSYGFVSMQNVHGTVVSWSNTQIVVTVPTNTNSGNLYVQQNGVNSNSSPFSVVPPASVTSVSPNSGFVGTSITLTGSNFGSSQGSSTVTFNGTGATPASWSATSIVVPVPSGATTGNVVVTLGGLASNGIPFTVLPSISSISPNSARVGTAVTITGSTFGVAQGTSTVTFNGTSATPASWSASSIVVPVPSGATSGNVVVTVNGQSSNAVPFTIATLQSISVTPASLSVSAGARQQFVAIATYSDGSTQDVTASASWSSSSPSVVAVNNSGLAAALGAGQVTIQASVGSISGSASFTVSALPASGPMLYARNSHTATRLNDGTVLLVGGVGNGSGIAGPSTVAIAEVYNPQAGTSSATGALLTPRFSHTASLLNDGTVLIAGGYDDDGDTQASAEIYSPASGTFSATQNMSTPRVYHTATVMNGLVLLVGGLDENYNDTGSAEVFNPATGTFTATGSLSIARDSHSATLLNDGTVLIAGGSDESGDALASTEIYNPSTGVFTAGPNMNVARWVHTATLLNDGMVLIVGGFDENGNTLNSAELYDPKAQTFTLIPATLANARANPTATLLNNGMVLIGGGTPDNFGNTLSSLELYDPTANTFATAGNMSLSRNSDTATRLDDGSVFIAGGINVVNTGDFIIHTTQASTEEYHPSNLTPPNLVSIMLSPSSPTIPGGTSQGLAAIGTFSDNSIQTLASALWTSSDNTLATVTSDATNQGEAYGVAQGTPEIIACAGAVCGSTNANITAPLLQITSLSPSSGDVGTPVTISGTQFGSTAGTVTFNGISAMIVNWTPTAILVNVPSGATIGNVIVSVNSMTSNSLLFTIVPRPQISGISPNIGVAGTQVTVTGVNFGAAQGNSVITFNGTAGTVLSWSDSTIVVSVPNVASTGNIVVTVSGLASNGQLFTIPVISNINPFDGPPGILLTIAGSGFGATQGSGTAMVGGTPITVFTWSDSQIVGAVAPGTQSGTVTVQQGSLTITGPAFTVDPSFPYTITPQSLSMVVGDSRTVSAVDSQGNPIKGLDWFATDTTIVSLSTDDPPVITALAPGSVTVYAGDVPLPINVYASTSAMPPGTPIWSVPVGGSGPVQVVPAVPSDSGADVFAMDSTGTLTALASDGSIVWKQPGTNGGSIIPDFSGSAVLKVPYSYIDSQGRDIWTHKVQYVNRATGALQDLYTFSDIGYSFGGGSDAETASGRFPVQTVIPHPSGVVFVQETSTISVIDPTGAQPTATISLLGGNHSATDVGKMIVAGDGNAYVPYTYTDGTFPSGSTTSSGTQHLMVLRIAPDGSSASTEIGTWSSTTNCVPWTDPSNRSGTQCSTSPAFGGVSDLHVITNADQGIAIFAIAASYGCSVTYVPDPQLNVCSGDAGHNHIDIYYVAQDALTSHVTDAAIFPNDLSGPLQFTPELQREDGSYIGSDNGENYVMAMGASGGILWQYQTGSHSTQDVPARPLYATSGGGVIFTTSTKDCAPGDITTTTLLTTDCIPQDGALPGDSDYGQLGTLYTLDQNGNEAVDANGNPIPPAPDAGVSYSWKGAYLASGDPVLANLSSPLPTLGQSYAATSSGNQTHNNVAVLQHSFGLFWCGTGYGEQGRPSQCIDDVSFGLTTVTNGTGTYVTRPTDSNIGQLQNFASSQPGWVGIIENSALAAYRKAFAEYPISVVLSSEHTNGSSRVFDQDFTTFVVGTWPTPEVGFDFPGSTGRLYFFAFMDGAQQALGHNLARGEQCPGLWCDLVLPYPVTSQTAGQFRAFMQAIGTAIGNAAAHETGHYLSKLSPGGSTGLPYMDCGAGAGNAVTQVVPCENNNNFVYNFFNGNGLPQDPNDPTSNGGQFFYLNVPGEPAIHWETSDKCWLKRYAAPESSCP